jgi:hypothetical protein
MGGASEATAIDHRPWTGFNTSQFDRRISAGQCRTFR